MKKVLLSGGVVLALTVLLAAPARAGFGVAGSVGAGFLADTSNFERSPFNIEITPTYKLGPVYADLSFIFDLEKGNNVEIRAGARLDLSLLYLRFAVPLRINNDRTYGFLVGVGKLFSVGPGAIFIELDVPMRQSQSYGSDGTTPQKGPSFGDVFPLEFRAGFQLTF